MAAALKLGEEKLGENDAYVQAILQGGDIDKTVNSLVDGTKLADPAFRKSLLDGGEAAVAASTDPMIVAARRVDPMVRATNVRLRDTYRQRAHHGRRKAGQGPLPGLRQRRLSRRHLHPAPQLRHRQGLSLQRHHRSALHHLLRPLRPRGQLQQQAALRPDAQGSRPPSASSTSPRRSTSSRTGDIIGGNSGSPVVNRDGELVGLIFDGNIESLAGDFVYDGSKNRAVAVHSAGMIEGLRKLYGANALADELEGKK